MQAIRSLALPAGHCFPVKIPMLEPWFCREEGCLIFMLSFSTGFNTTRNRYSSSWLFRSCICFTTEQNLAPEPFWSPFTCMNNCCMGIHIFGVVPSVCILFCLLFASLGTEALQLFCGDILGTMREKCNMYCVLAFSLFLYGSLKMRKQSCALSNTNWIQNTAEIQAVV